MKFLIPLLAAASLVTADDNPLNSIPTCAQSCVGKFLTGSNIAGCSLLDYKCVCSNESFINQIACCIAPVCDDKGKSDTIALANKLCKAFDVNLPTAVTCNTAAATSTGSATSSGSATSASAATPTTNGASSGSATTGATNSAAASTSSSKAGAAPTNVAGLVGAAAVLAFAL
ncbi:Extracellular membrane protein, 8-cysteine region, CFEM [Cordyceps fumosorosea ARSEF 2679]|uniref:Extracellular membrane protein, 8-cysteine region, CFEM n=1 Tax=Cordyceps fumosorosea (strain ARSEF 2679) TaxID=1081104 RepID=A0A162JQR5_CORFA|nr:Extracellular membrane protein, 8-cysteine region, CFEM [Cordyceps fumosorosea ARSEF 2679]OAA72392.1 Extracellular membrane protein, 8-cysteine region, CFEM [Cordyceps fumosorosea ARSEF 2679]